MLTGDLVPFAISELEEGFEGEGLEGLPCGVIVMGGTFSLESGSVFVLKHTQDALSVGALVESGGFAQDQGQRHGLVGSANQATTVAL